MPELQKTGVQLVAEGSAEFERAMSGARDTVRDFGRQGTTNLGNVQRAMETAWSAAKQFAKGFGMAAGAVTGMGMALMALVDDAVDYIQVAGQTARVLGITTEEASRAIAVVDDLGVSQQAFTASMRVAMREGVSPTVEGLAQMSDHYLSLATTQERASYAQSMLGRNWLEFSRVLDAGGDRIREMGRGIAQSLIVTGNAYQMTELYRVSVDNLGDAWMSFKVILAQYVLPSLTTAVTRIALQIQYMEEGENVVSAWAHAVTTADQAIAQMNADLEANTANLAPMPASVQTIATSFDDVSTSAGNARAAIDGVNTSLAGTIEQFRTNLAWFAGGGPQLEAAAAAVQNAVAAGQITPEEADQLFQPIEAAALGLQVDIGAITMSEAQRTMISDWGGNWSDARREIQGAQQDILNIPSEVQSAITVAVQWYVTGGKRGGFQHGGSFMVGGPGGTDKTPVSFMATRGERVIILPQTSAPAAAPSYVDSHDSRSLNIGQMGADLTNPFLVKKIVQQGLFGA